MRKWILPMVALLAFCAVPVRAEVDVSPLRTLYSKAAPVDTAISGDGKVFFVLTAKHSLEVYDQQGTLQGTVAVDPGVDRVRSSAAGDMVYLTDSKKKETHVLAVEMIKKIDTKGSPFRGPADAPVVIAVFSDFQ